MLRSFLLTAVVAVTAALAVPSASQAGMTYRFTQTNIESTLPDGGNYGTIKLDDHVSDATVASGSVRFIFDRNPARDIGTVKDRYSEIGINSSLDHSVLLAAGWSAPTNWARVIPNKMDGFGYFDIGFVGNGDADRVSTGTIIISGLTAAQARIGNFQRNSSNTSDRSDSLAPTQGYTFFGAHIIPADGGATGYIGTRGTLDGSGDDGTIATPAPAGLILAALGIPAFGLLRRITRKSGAARVAV